MKIYILRHEDRTQDCSFFSPLTEIGLEKSEMLIPILNKYKINMIISSPFIRTLQTINPYCKETHQTINLEYSLCELHHTDIIAKQSVGIYLPEYIAKAFNYNPNYKSFIKPCEIIYPETEENLNLRIKNFLKDLICKNYKNDVNILLVTHESICLNILNIVVKSGYPDIIDLNNYDKGKLCEVFDGIKWTFEMLN
jgi:broad specificity phosphatase PhoE